MTVREMDVTIEDVMALSPLQAGLLSRGLLGDAEGVDPYLITMAADIAGPLDVAMLHECVDAILVRHPNLRVSFVHHDLPHPVQVVPSRVDPPWRHVHCAPADLSAIENEERTRPFDLERGPLIRFLLAELGGQRWRFVITAHHIILDGWSLPVLVSELLALYGADADVSCLGGPPRPYRDYIGWLADRDHEASEDVWRQYLAGLDGPTLLSQALAVDPPKGLPRRVEVVMDDVDSRRLVHWAMARGVTVNTLVQVAWALVLARFTDRDDVVFGVTVSGRPAELAAVESMVGLFVNTVPLRVRIDPEVTVAHLCSAVQQDAARLRDHGYLTHSRLRALGGVGEMFDTLLVYENFPPGAVVGAQEFRLGGVTFRPAALESLSHFPVTVAAHLLDSRLTLLVEAVENALGGTDAETLGRRILSTVQHLLDGWDRRIGDVDVLLPEEAREPGRPTASAPVTGGFTDRFAAVAAVHPDAVALSWVGGRVTYRQLDEAVDDVAASLAEHGTGTETPVAIRLSRGSDYVVAMLAVMRAGGVCVPLDNDLPEERVRSILRQTGAVMTIEGDLPAAATAGFRRPLIHADQSAYLVFTSGTTGEPKGVVATHRGLLAYADDHVDKVLRPAAARLGRPLRIAHAWSFAFDAAWQPLAALLDGHEVHIIDENDRRDAMALTKAIDANRIDMIDTTPSMFGQLRACGLLDEVPLAVLALGGEAVGRGLWADIAEVSLRTGMTALNCYGPTEATVESVVAVVTDHHRPMIGHPTRTITAPVLDSRLRPTPDGVVGELYLAGEQVTRGYLDRPAETAVRYVAAPGGERMYRTGDLVRRHRNGALQFIGRSDGQVKIRGYRVELKEIESALMTHPAVRHAHVLVETGGRHPRLTAFVAGGAAVAELRTLLRTRLPRFMMPHRLVVVDDIPLTVNGKPDEAALRSAVPESTALAGPSTDTERSLALVFAELLDVPRIDIDVDVLELGLDSITAVSAIQAARRRGVALRAHMIAECGTVRELAAAVDSVGTVEPTAEQHGGPMPVLPVMHWLYEHGDPRRLAQTYVLRLPAGSTAARLRAMLDAVVAGHPVLRSRFDRATMSLVVCEGGRWPLTEVEADDEASVVAEHAARTLETLDPERGSMLSAVWVHRPEDAGVLILTAHVIALDPVSWRVILAELDAGWHAAASGLEPARLTERTGYGEWAQMLERRARELDTLPFWVGQLSGDDPPLGSRRVDPSTDRAGDLAATVTVADADVTGALLRAGTPMHHFLIAATARCLSRWRIRNGQPRTQPLVAIEGHGRADTVMPGADTSETAGLFTTIYPLRVAADATVAAVAARMTAIPGAGIDYGLLRYLREDTAEHLRALREPQVLLNYLGRVDIGNTGQLRFAEELSATAPMIPEPNLVVRHELTVSAGVMRLDGPPRLVVQWRTLPSILTAAEVEELQSFWHESLRALAAEVTE